MNTLKNISFRRFFSYLHLCCVSYDPVRDWLLLLSLAGLALAAVLGWNLWTFSSIAQGQTIGAPATQASGFDQAILSTVHSIFDERAAEETKYESGGYEFSDPSQ